MHRTARALSVAVLAGAVLGGGTPAAFADPSAEVSPGTAEAGGNVSVSVSCDPVGTAPETLDATSEAFDPGTVRLTHLPAADDAVSGPQYQGTARLTAAAGDSGAGNGDGASTGSGDGTDTVGPDTVPEPAGSGAAGTDAVTTDGVVGGPAWTVGGTCPAAPGEQGQPWSTTFTVGRGTHQTAGDTGGTGGTGDTGGTGALCPRPQPRADAVVPRPTPTLAPDHDSCVPTPPPADVSTTAPTHHHPTSTPAPVQRGVEAGAGGSLTPSVPALATGAALIAAALGGAVYRLRRKGLRRHG
ncbi:hypothetical protein [Streptomyces sp. YIM S03343]